MPPMCTEAQAQKIGCICDSFLGLGLRQVNGTRQQDSISRVFLLAIENLVVYSNLASRVPITTARDDLGHMWLLCLFSLTWCPSVIWKTSKTGACDIALADSRNEDRCQKSGVQLLDCGTSVNFWDTGLVGKPSALGCRIGSSSCCLAIVS